MREGIVFAGFGGQGIILSGLILCHAAMEEGKQVSHIPSYDEMQVARPTAPWWFGPRHRLALVPRPELRG
jgi:Pyruvate/2-oxoacid:ferredoxin oxidoreductase gamma subunit